MEVEGQQRIATGVDSLDEIIKGGLIPNRAYLVRGAAGSGKTTLGLHFLSAAVERGENALFITFSETAEQIQRNAASIGIDAESIVFLDLSPSSGVFSEMQFYDIFSASEIEREPITQRIRDAMQEIKPTCVLLDAVTHLRYLTDSDMEFRRFVLSLLRYVTEQEATFMITSEQIGENGDAALQFVSDGIIWLREHDYGRTVRISKLRGSDYLDGEHTVRLTDRGMFVYPRLEAGAHETPFRLDVVSTGIEGLDTMLSGGLERGTVTLLTGPTGVGKTTLGMQFMKAASERGERSVIFTFEEDDRILIERGESMGIPVIDMIDSGVLQINQIEPFHYSPDEFAHMIRNQVEKRDTDLIMIDSVAGYALSLHGDDLMKHLHTLTKYLRNRGVTTILTNELHRIADPFQATEINVSYLMDSILYLRYVERAGELRRVIGVLKKRVSDFEKSLREIILSSDGVTIGTPLTNLRGFLTGSPSWVDDNEGLT